MFRNALLDEEDPVQLRHEQGIDEYGNIINPLQWAEYQYVNNPDPDALLPKGMTRNDFVGMDPSQIFQIADGALTQEDHQLIQLLQGAKQEQARLDRELIAKGITPEHIKRQNQQKSSTSKLEPKPLYNIDTSRQDRIDLVSLFPNDDDPADISLDGLNVDKMPTQGELNKFFEQIGSIVPGFDKEMQQFHEQELLHGKLDHKGHPILGSLDLSSDPLNFRDALTNPDHPLNHPAFKALSTDQKEQLSLETNKAKLSFDAYQEMKKLDSKSLSTKIQEQFSTIPLDKINSENVGDVYVLKEEDLKKYSPEQRQFVKKLDNMRGLLQTDIVEAKRYNDSSLIQRQIVLLEKQQKILSGELSDADRVALRESLDVSKIRLNPIRLEPELWIEERRLFFELFNLDKTIGSKNLEVEWWSDYLYLHSLQLFKGLQMKDAPDMSDHEIALKLKEISADVEKLTKSRRFIQMQHKFELDKVMEVLEKRNLFHDEFMKDLREAGLEEAELANQSSMLEDYYAIQQQSDVLHAEFIQLHKELELKRNHGGQFFNLAQLQQEDFESEVYAKYQDAPRQHHSLYAQPGSESAILRVNVTIDNVLGATTSNPSQTTTSSIISAVPSLTITPGSSNKSTLHGNRFDTPITSRDPDNPNAAFDEILKLRPTLTITQNQLIDPITKELLPSIGGIGFVDSEGDFVSKSPYVFSTPTPMQPQSEDESSREYGRLPPDIVGSYLVDGVDPAVLDPWNIDYRDKPAMYIQELAQHAAYIDPNQPEYLKYLRREELEQNRRRERVYQFLQSTIEKRQIKLQNDYLDPDEISPRYQQQALVQLHEQMDDDLYASAMNNNNLSNYQFSLQSPTDPTDFTSYRLATRPKDSTVSLEGVFQDSTSIQGIWEDRKKDIRYSIFRSPNTIMKQQSPLPYLQYKYYFHLPVYDGKEADFNFYDYSKLQPQSTHALRPIKRLVPLFDQDLPPALHQPITRPVFPPGTPATIQNLHIAYTFIWKQIRNNMWKRHLYNLQHYGLTVTEDIPEDERAVIEQSNNSSLKAAMTFHHKYSLLTNILKLTDGEQVDFEDNNRLKRLLPSENIVQGIRQEVKKARYGDPTRRQVKRAIYDTHPIYRTHMSLFSEINENNKHVQGLIHNYNKQQLDNQTFLTHHSPTDVEHPNLFQLFLRHKSMRDIIRPYDRYEGAYLDKLKASREAKRNTGTLDFSKPVLRNDEIDFRNVPAVLLNPITERVFTKYGDIDTFSFSLYDDINTLGYYTSPDEIPTYEQYLSILMYDSMYMPLYPDNNSDIWLYERYAGCGPYFHYFDPEEFKRLKTHQIDENSRYWQELLREERFLNGMRLYRGLPSKNYGRVTDRSVSTILPLLPHLNDFHYYLYPHHRPLFPLFQRYYLSKVRQKHEKREKKWRQEVKALIDPIKQHRIHFGTQYMLHDDKEEFLNQTQSDLLEKSSSPLPPYPKRLRSVKFDKLSFNEMIAPSEIASARAVTRLLSQTNYISNDENILDETLHVALSEAPIILEDDWFNPDLAGLKIKNELLLPYYNDLIPPPLNPDALLINTDPSIPYKQPPPFTEYQHFIFDDLKVDRDLAYDGFARPKTTQGHQLFEELGSFLEYLDEYETQLLGDMDLLLVTKPQRKIVQYGGVHLVVDSVPSFEYLEPADHPFPEVVKQGMIQYNEYMTAMSVYWEDRETLINTYRDAYLEANPDDKDLLSPDNIGLQGSGSFPLPTDSVDSSEPSQDVDVGNGDMIQSVSNLEEKQEAEQEAEQEVSEPQKFSFFENLFGFGSREPTDSEQSSNVKQSSLFANLFSVNQNTQDTPPSQLNTPDLSETNPDILLDTDNTDNTTTTSLLDTDNTITTSLLDASNTTSSSAKGQTVHSLRERFEAMQKSSNLLDTTQPSRDTTTDEETGDNSPTEDKPQDWFDNGGTNSPLNKDNETSDSLQDDSNEIANFDSTEIPNLYITRRKYMYYRDLKDAPQSTKIELLELPFIYNSIDIERTQQAALGFFDPTTPFNIFTSLDRIFSQQYGIKHQVLIDRLTHLFLSYYRHRVNSLLPKDLFSLYIQPHVPPVKVGINTNPHNLKSENGFVYDALGVPIRPLRTIFQHYVNNQSSPHGTTHEQTLQHHQYKMNQLNTNYGESLFRFPVRLPPKSLLLRAKAKERTIKTEAKNSGGFYSLQEIDQYLVDLLTNLDQSRVIYTAADGTVDSYDKAVFNAMKLDAQTFNLPYSQFADASKQSLGGQYQFTVSDVHNMIDQKTLQDQLLNVIELDKRLTQLSTLQDADELDTVADKSKESITNKRSKSVSDSNRRKQLEEETREELRMLQNSIDFTVQLQQYEVEKQALLTEQRKIGLDQAKKAHLLEIETKQQQLLGKKKQLEKAKLSNYSDLGLTPPTIDQFQEHFHHHNDEVDLTQEEQIPSEAEQIIPTPSNPPSPIDATITRATNFLSELTGVIKNITSPPSPPNDGNGDNGDNGDDSGNDGDVESDIGNDTDNDEDLNEPAGDILYDGIDKKYRSQPKHGSIRSQQNEPKNDPSASLLAFENALKLRNEKLRIYNKSQMLKLFRRKNIFTMMKTGDQFIPVPRLPSQPEPDLSDARYDLILDRFIGVPIEIYQLNQFGLHDTLDNGQTETLSQKLEFNRRERQDYLSRLDYFLPKVKVTKTGLSGTEVLQNIMLNHIQHSLFSDQVQVDHQGNSIPLDSQKIDENINDVENDVIDHANRSLSMHESSGKKNNSGFSKLFSQLKDGVSSSFSATSKNTVDEKTSKKIQQRKKQFNMSKLPRYFEFDFFDEPRSTQIVSTLKPQQLNRLHAFVKHVRSRQYPKLNDILRFRAKFEENKSTVISQQLLKFDLLTKDLEIPQNELSKIHHKMLKDIDILDKQMKFEEPKHIKTTPLPNQFVYHPSIQDYCLDSLVTISTTQSNENDEKNNKNDGKGTLHVSLPDVQQYEQFMLFNYTFKGLPRGKELFQGLQSISGLGQYSHFYVANPTYGIDKSLNPINDPILFQYQLDLDNDNRSDIELTPDELDQRYFKRRAIMEKQSSSVNIQRALKQLDQSGFFNPTFPASTYFIHTERINHFNAPVDVDLYNHADISILKELRDQKRRTTIAEWLQNRLPIILSHSDDLDLQDDSPHNNTNGSKQSLFADLPESLSVFLGLNAEKDAFGRPLPNRDQLLEKLSREGKIKVSDDDQFQIDIETARELAAEYFGMDPNTLLDDADPSQYMITRRLSNIPAYDYFNPIYSKALLQDELNWRKSQQMNSMGLSNLNYDESVKPFSTLFDEISSSPTSKKYDQHSKTNSLLNSKYSLNPDGRVHRTHGLLFGMDNYSEYEPKALEQYLEKYDKYQPYGGAIDGSKSKNFPIFPFSPPPSTLKSKEYRETPLVRRLQNGKYQIEYKLSYGLPYEDPWKTLSPSLRLRFKDQCELLEEDHQLNTYLLHPIEVQDAFAFFEKNNFEPKECFGYIDRLRTIISHRRDEFIVTHGHSLPEIDYVPPAKIPIEVRAAAILGEGFKARLEAEQQQRAEKALSDMIAAAEEEKFQLAELEQLGHLTAKSQYLKEMLEKKDLEKEESFQLLKKKLSPDNIIVSFGKVEFSDEDLRKPLDLSRYMKNQSSEEGFFQFLEESMESLSLPHNYIDPATGKTIQVINGKKVNPHIRDSIQAVLDGKIPQHYFDEYDASAQEYLPGTGIPAISQPDKVKLPTPTESSFRGEDVRDPIFVSYDFAKHEAYTHPPSSLQQASATQSLLAPTSAYGQNTLQLPQKTRGFLLQPDGRISLVPEDPTLLPLPRLADYEDRYPLDPSSEEYQHGLVMAKVRQLTDNPPINSFTGKPIVHAIPGLFGSSLNMDHYVDADLYIENAFPITSSSAKTVNEARIEIEEKTAEEPQGFASFFSFGKKTPPSSPLPPPTTQSRELNDSPSRFTELIEPRSILGDKQLVGSRDYIDELDRHLELLQFRPSVHEDGFFIDSSQSKLNQFALNLDPQDRLTLKYNTQQEIDDFYFTNNPYSQIPQLKALRQHWLARTGPYTMQKIRYRAHLNDLKGKHTLSMSVLDRSMYIDPDDYLLELEKYKKEHPEHTLEQIQAKLTSENPEDHFPQERDHLVHRLKRAQQRNADLENGSGFYINPYNYFGLTPEVIESTKMDTIHYGPTIFSNQRATVGQSYLADQFFSRYPQAYLSPTALERFNARCPSIMPEILPKITKSSTPDDLEQVMRYMLDNGVIHVENTDQVWDLVDEFRSQYQIQNPDYYFGPAPHRSSSSRQVNTNPFEPFPQTSLVDESFLDYVEFTRKELLEWYTTRDQATDPGQINPSLAQPKQLDPWSVKSKFEPTPNEQSLYSDALESIKNKVSHALEFNPLTRIDPLTIVENVLYQSKPTTSSIPRRLELLQQYGIFPQRFGAPKGLDILAPSDLILDDLVSGQKGTHSQASLEDQKNVLYSSILQQIELPNAKKLGHVHASKDSQGNLIHNFKVGPLDFGRFVENFDDDSQTEEELDKEMHELFKLADESLHLEMQKHDKGISVNKADPSIWKPKGFWEGVTSSFDWFRKLTGRQPIKPLDIRKDDIEAVFPPPPQTITDFRDTSYESRSLLDDLVGRRTRLPPTLSQWAHADEVYRGADGRIHLYPQNIDKMTDEEVSEALKELENQ